MHYPSSICWIWTETNHNYNLTVHTRMIKRSRFGLPSWCKNSCPTNLTPRTILAVQSYADHEKRKKKQ